MKGIMKLRLAFITFIICYGAAFAQGSSKFRVVLDPGHGAKDYGAVYYGFIEKNIALNVALKVGKLLEKEGVQVVYTRKTDVFIELDERCNIANKANANVFVSIHCNGEAKKQAYGTETFVMGPTKNASHLEVAKRENSVINLESDKQKYQGFDPNKPETLIGLTLQHEEGLNQSIDLASRVEERFTDDLKRKKRGVKQAPFWVLHRTAMPSILIELGFLSYKPEGEYLNSDDGQDELAGSIAKAILAYKKEYFIPGNVNYAEPKEDSKPVAEQEDKPVKPVKPATSTVVAATKGESFRIQIAASGKDLELIPSNFNGLKNITKDKSTSVIKYFYGEAPDREQAKVLLAEAKAKGYTSAFIATFRDGKRI